MDADPSTAAPVATARRPRVVMVVNNGIATDARVIKSAVSLRRAGAEVIVLGVAPYGSPRAETEAGGVRFVRLPVIPGRGLTPAYATWALRVRAARLGDPENWQHSVPATRYYRRAFVPELLRLNPDVIHVHDIHILAAVTEAVRRSGAESARPAIIYDAHEYVASLAVAGNRASRHAAGWRALERECLPSVDRLITVSPQIADKLQADNALAERPAVVFNAPLAFDGVVASRSLRAEAGVGDGVPLVVYSGGLSVHRGVGTVIEAMAAVPDAHLAVVAVPFPNKMAPQLEAVAAEHRVSDRFHLVPPVPAHEVPAYLAGADVGIHPMLGDIPNHEMALPNKLFEFIHAGLTIVVSDVLAMSTFVREHGLGEVFHWGDAAQCAQALVRALDHPSTADTSALRREFSWQTQERTLVDVYRSLAVRTASLGSLAVPDEPWDDASLTLRF